MSLIKSPELDLIREEAKNSQPLVDRIAKLTVTHAGELQMASTLLNEIHTIRQKISDRIMQILKPLNEAVSSVAGLHKELDGPFSQAEKDVRSKIYDFRLAETRRLQAEDEERKKHAEELAKQATALKAKEESAVTAKMKQKFAQQRYNVQAEAAIAKIEKPPEPVKVEGSTSRSIKKVRFKDEGIEHFMRGVLEGKIEVTSKEHEVLTVAYQLVLNRLYKNDPSSTRNYPGVEEYDDVIIVRR